MNKEPLRLNLPGAAAFVSAPECRVCFSRALRASLFGAARGVAYPLTTFGWWLSKGWLRCATPGSTNCS